MQIRACRGIADRGGQAESPKGPAFRHFSLSERYGRRCGRDIAASEMFSVDNGKTGEKNTLGLDSWSRALEKTCREPRSMAVKRLAGAQRARIRRPGACLLKTILQHLVPWKINGVGGSAFVRRVRGPRPSP